MVISSNVADPSASIVEVLVSLNLPTRISFDAELRLTDIAPLEETSKSPLAPTYDEAVIIPAVIFVIAISGDPVRPCAFVAEVAVPVNVEETVRAH